MEAFNFTLANEDHNLYTFDMRKLDVARSVHMDHVSAVLAVDYSPTGREFVSGSYDRTLRIWQTEAGRRSALLSFPIFSNLALRPCLLLISRDIYHTKRMQRLFAVQFSGDSNFIFAGSDDTNIRMWKSNASRDLGVVRVLRFFYQTSYTR